MWNNYTVDMQNPDKMKRAQAEADAMRLADEATGSTGAEKPAGSSIAGARRTIALGSWMTHLLRHHPHAPHLARGHHA